MRQGSDRHAGRAMFLALLLVTLARPPLAAQDSTQISLDFGGHAVDTIREPAPDSVLRRAIAIFNAPTTTRIYGGTVLNTPVAGALGIFEGDVRITNRVDGDIVVINGSLRLEASARITGRVIVLGGQFFADPGATYPGPVLAYRERSAVRRTSDLTLEPARGRPSLSALAGGLTAHLGSFEVSPHLLAGVYNRVEGMPIRVGPTIRWRQDSSSLLQVDLDATLRTARDPDHVRGQVGWWARAAWTELGTTRWTAGIEAGQRIEHTADHATSPREWDLWALLSRRDRRDWYATRQWDAFGSWSPLPRLTLSGELAFSRQRSVSATDPLSILQSEETWVPNPLVDDGRFASIRLDIGWDTRNVPHNPEEGWWLRFGVRRTTGSDITPVALPTQVRDAIPADGYESYESWFDLRRYQLLAPNWSLQARLMGEGWIGGDPLTLQRRLSIGGNDFLGGFAYREFTCDPRRRADPAMPALCDRRMMAQLEVRRSLGVRLGTHVGPYALGIDGINLVALADLGSAWIAGDGPGQVPADRIRSLSEWQGDIGAGVEAGRVGLYVFRAFTESEPFRFTVKFTRRF